MKISKKTKIPAFYAGERMSREAIDRLDNCSQAGADRLAKRMQKAWHDLGHTQVKCWAEKAEGKSKNLTAKGTVKSITGIWGVKTNLVNGLPPRRDA